LTAQPDAAAEVVRGWFPDDPEPTAAQTRKHELADSVRSLITAVLQLHVPEADAGELDEVQRLLDDAHRRLAAMPDICDRGGLYGTPENASLFERSPFSGRSNALAAPLVVRSQGARTVAHAVYGAAHEGPPGSVHGGHVMAAFDDVLGVAQAASGTAGFTGTLTVRMAARTPLHERIDYEAGVESRSGRKVTVWGRSTCRGELLAEASGIFITPRAGMQLPESG
jgi:acyl-coenzyme A thioesterase PaaI-like protein